MEVVRKLVGGKSAAANGDAVIAKVETEIEEGKTNAQETEEPAATNGDEAKANVAAEVADSAQKLDAGVEA